MLYVTKISHSDEVTSRIVQNECLSAGQDVAEALRYAKPYLLSYAQAMIRDTLPDGFIFQCEKYNIDKHKDTNRYHLVTI
jgi:hypothetical protein